MTRYVGVQGGFLSGGRRTICRYYWSTPHPGSRGEWQGLREICTPAKCDGGREMGKASLSSPSKTGDGPVLAWAHCMPSVIIGCLAFVVEVDKETEALWVTYLSLRTFLCCFCHLYYLCRLLETQKIQSAASVLCPTWALHHMK